MTNSNSTSHIRIGIIVGSDIEAHLVVTWQTYQGHTVVRGTIEALGRTYSPGILRTIQTLGTTQVESRELMAKAVKEVIADLLGVPEEQFLAPLSLAS